jgi:hypothetical protein
MSHKCRALEMKTTFQDLPAVEQKHLQALQEPFPFAPGDGNVEMALSALREKARQQIHLNQACEYHTPSFLVVHFPIEEEFWTRNGLFPTVSGYVCTKWCFKVLEVRAKEREFNCLKICF